jgi:hypothetical protein
MSRHPRHKKAKLSGRTEAEPDRKGLSPEAWEMIARLLISSLGPIANLLDAISRLH